MRRPRPIPLALAAISIATLAISVTLLAQRIARYNDEQGRVTYLHEEITARTFTYAGHEVAITDLPPDAARPHGAVRIRFADETLTLPVTIPPLEYTELFEGLEKHGDWLRLVRFAKLSDRSLKELLRAIDAGEEPDRLVLVTKTPRPGANPNTWGRVWRKDWTFDLYEFLPEGRFRHERFAYPTARSAEEQDEQRRARAEGAGGLPELDTRSWQFQVAHLLMPEGSAPRIISGDSPLAAVGWTFPVAILSVLTLTAGLLGAFAPNRPTDSTPEA